MRYTVLSWSTSSRARRSSPGDRSTLEARFSRKSWTPRLERSSNEIPMLYSWVTQNQANRSLTSLSGSWTFPGTSPTDRGGRGGPGLPMASVEAGRWESVGWQRHRLPRGLCLGVNWFREPSQGNSTNVLKPQLVPKGAGIRFFTFPAFWGQQSNHLPYFLRSGTP